jgi:hypothetical protein
MFKEAIAFEPLEVQLRRRAFARLLENRLQVNAALCSYHRRGNSVLSADRIRTLVAELDSEVPREGAFARLVQYGGGPDEAYLVANERGYLRLGIEFLRAAIAPTTADAASTRGRVLDIDLDYVLDPDSDVGIDYLERREDLGRSVRSREPMGWPQRFRFAIIALVVLAAVAVWLIGFVAIARWAG